MGERFCSVVFCIDNCANVDSSVVNHQSRQVKTLYPELGVLSIKVLNDGVSLDFTRKTYFLEPSKNCESYI